MIPASVSAGNIRCLDGSGSGSGGASPEAKASGGAALRVARQR